MVEEGQKNRARPERSRFFPVPLVSTIGVGVGFGVGVGVVRFPNQLLSVGEPDYLLVLVLG